MSSIANERIADMTLQELRTFVEAVVEEKMNLSPMSQRPLTEVLQSMWDNMITPAPNQPSTLEMLREDRDR